jgi:hypothetical protein
MNHLPSPPLSDLIAAVEKRKRQKIWKILQIPPHLKIIGLQFDCMAYHLTERSGPVFVQLNGDTLKVAESDQGKGIAYQNDAIDFILNRWNISTEEAERGIFIELKEGARV